MIWSLKDVAGLLLFFAAMAAAIILRGEPTTRTVKWLSLALTVATFGAATAIAHHSEATIGLCGVALPFVLAADSALKHWFHPTRREPPPGKCQKCGYNLTANVSGVCPECGAKL